MDRSLSASSSTSIWHWLALAIPFSSRSSRRPGVATITWTVERGEGERGEGERGEGERGEGERRERERERGERAKIHVM